MSDVKTPGARLYMPHAGHFIGGISCSFHLNTYVPTGYIVSTVGEYRPSVVFERGGVMRSRRDDDPPKALGGEPDSMYETMVFKAVAATEPGSCCPWRQESGEDIDADRYATPDAATEGHEAMCRKWEAPQ